MTLSAKVHQFLLSRDLGGAALIARNLAKEVAQRGQRARVWLPGSGAASAAMERAGLTWRRFGLENMQRGPLRHAWTCARLAGRLCFSRGLAHVHAPGVYRMLRPALRFAGMRTAVHVHLEPAEAEIRWAFGQPPDLVIPCARFMVGRIREILGERGEPMRMVAVPNAVDLERYYPQDKIPAKQRVGAPADSPLLLMLANLAPHKGQETAVRAVAELRRRGIHVTCWLAGVERHGTTGFEERLRTLAQELEVADRVRFLGFRSDGPELLAAADMLLLPSKKEGLPLTVLEAQASKVPVIANATAGVPEIIADGATGFLVPADDAAGYAERVALLLQNPEVALRMTESAYAQVRREHTWATYVSRILDLYEELLSAPRARTRGAGVPSLSCSPEGITAV
jgi:glycosyltransferase involved in cell wall biosynthesis